jgi:Ni,Fe-hydrogenase I large subunit
MHGHPLLAAWIERRGRGAGARLLARLLELAVLPQRLRVGGGDVVKAHALGDNVGMAAIETSRGLLIHAVRLSGNLVAEYRIVAPTEWNFHPAGALTQAMADLVIGNDAQARAQAICQSLDPCVAFGVELTDA